MDKKIDSQRLYKYRNISNFRFFVDILLNNQLYGAKYDELNDPFEGLLLSHTEKISESLAEHRKKLREARKNYRICSLSKVHDNNLMWSHYADGHRGCCIEFVVEENDNWKMLDVNYDDKALNINSNTTIEDVLSHKLSPWSYEEEVRYISTVSRYLKVRITKIYLGFKMVGPDRTFIRKLVAKINPEIIVEDMPKSTFLR